MSAPDTDVEKQSRWHRGPLVGITIGLIVVVIMGFVFAGGDDIDDDDAIEGAAPLQEGAAPAPDTQETAPAE